MDSLIRNISACVQRVLVILVKNAITVRVNGLTDFFMRDEDTQYFDPDCYLLIPIRINLKGPDSIPHLSETQ